MALDERLHREMEHAARPADPSGVYEHLIRRRERRRLRLRIEQGALAVFVVIATAGGVYALSRVFVQGRAGPAAGAEGVIMFSGRAPGSPFGLLTIDVATGELGGIPGSDVGQPETAAWSPDGAKIAFARKGERGLFVMNADGSGLRLLSDLRATDPVWSPDGSRIAFTAKGDTDDAIYIVDADGVTTTWIARGGWPSWSPDGSELVYTDRGVLMVQGADPDADPRPLGVGMGSRPDWSPDGSKIVFVADAGLIVASADGSGVTHVRSEPGSYLDPIWSPDGSTIAFAYRAPIEDCPTDRCSRYGVWVMNADGSGARRLTALATDEGSESGPSPDWYPLGGSAPSVVPIDRSPTPEPSPVETPSVGGGRDVGLGFPVCNVSTIEAPFVSPDANATVYVATKKGDVGGCPAPENADNVVAIDLDGDGRVETAYGPIACMFECRPFSAPDLDGDGTAELLVLQQGGAVVGLDLYDVVARGSDVTIEPVTIAPPGDPAGGFEAGTQALLWLGGDEFELYTLTCGDLPAPEGPGLVATAAEARPHDSPDGEWHAHAVTLALRDGSVQVVEVSDFVEPIDGTPTFGSGEDLCGSNLGP